MEITLSNKSPCTAAITVLADASATGDSVAETTPVAPGMSETVIAMLAIGSCLALVWVVRRIVHPEKLSLSHAPGRPGNLNAGHALIVLVVLVMAGMAAVSALLELGLSKSKALVLGVTFERLVWMAVLLPLGATLFRFGLVRGMGLSARHWLYDTFRGFYAYLAVFPLCIAMLNLSSLVIPAKPHPMLAAAGELSTPWLALLVFAAVVLAPVSEELLFRGLLQSAARRHLGNAWLAVLLTSAAFALLHLRIPQTVLPIFILSLVLGYTYERSGRLFSPILIHMLFNGVSTALFLTQAG
ncbi:MAG: CPBP family intramembrane glutamic endopeptidase [Phycisphaerae bacterium]